MNKAKVSYVEQPAEVWNPDGTPKVLVRIQGLAQTGPDEFELSGVKPRPVDWFAVGVSMGFGPDGMPDDLADELSAVVWKHDMIRILAERMRPV